jgi:uncharacterized protein (TIGR02001 family)
MFKKTTLALAISALAGGALAQSAPAPAPAPAPATSPITANVTIVNDYRYRGMTQSNYKPAIQGGFDYAHESGFYIGNWNSSISWISDGYDTGVNGNRNVSAPLEMDFYAGYKTELLGKGQVTDVGILQYYYATTNFPSNSCTASTANSSQLGRNACGANPNTTELYAAQNFAYGPLSGFFKVSYSLTNIFGIHNSKGSYYPDLTLNYDTGFEGITLNGHIGYQKVAGTKTVSGVKYDFSYMDYKLGLTKDFGGGLTGSIAYVATSQPKQGSSYYWYVPASDAAGTQSKSMGKGGGLVSLTKTF